MSKQTYTAFCQDIDGRGTIWISDVEADSPESAAGEAREKCAEDWGCDVEGVHCLGIAEGNVNILLWDDLDGVE